MADAARTTAPEVPAAAAPVEVSGAPAIATGRLEGGESRLAWVGLLVLAGVFAVPAAFASVLFIMLVRAVTEVAWVTVPAGLGLPEPVVLLGVPVLGGLVVGIIVRFVPGHGGADPADEHGIGGGHPGTLRELPGLVAATTASLASGASLGPEAPLVGILGTLGAETSRLLRLPPDVGRMLGIAGLSAVLGGLFGSPLAVALFLVEATPFSGRELYRRVFPSLIAATIGLYVFIVVLGSPFASFEFPAYPGLQAWHLAAAAVIGAAGAVVGLGYIRLTVLIRRVLRPLARRTITKAVVGGIVVGVVALVAGDITLFSGEHEIQTILDDGPSMSVLALVGIALAKMLAAGVSLSTGFRGGRIFPVLFIGATLGMAIHVLLPGIPAALTVATGMAGLGIATFRVPLFLVTLLVVFTTPDVAPLTLIAAIAGWIIVEGRDEL